MYTVYLVGALSEDVATHEWRQEAENILMPNFDIINPAKSAYDIQLVKKADGSAEKFYRIVMQGPSEILLPKSYKCVERADILLCNLQIEPVGRPMIGSICEIAWGWQLHKTMIGMRGDNFYSKHPIIVGAMTAWANDVKAACKIIQVFFSGGNSIHVKEAKGGDV